jgi:hypothetical protein
MLRRFRHLVMIAAVDLVLQSGVVDAHIPYPTRQGRVPVQSNLQNYSCRFDQIISSIKCFRQGQPPLIIEFELDGVKPELIDLLFSQQISPPSRISVQTDDPALFKRQLEQFRDALDSILPKVEDARAASRVDTDLYYEIIKTYSLGVSRYRSYMNARFYDDKNYSCGLRQDPTSIGCVLENNNDTVFTFPFLVTPEFLEFLLTGQIKMSREAFRLELEDFNNQLEELRTKAEEIRVSNTKLYKQIIAAYNSWIGKYRVGIGMYTKTQTL